MMAKIGILIIGSNDIEDLLVKIAICIELYNEKSYLLHVNCGGKIFAGLAACGLTALASYLLYDSSAFASYLVYDGVSYVWAIPPTILAALSAGIAILHIVRINLYTGYYGGNRYLCWSKFNEF